MNRFPYAVVLLVIVGLSVPTTLVYAQSSGGNIGNDFKKCAQKKGSGSGTSSGSGGAGKAQSGGGKQYSNRVFIKNGKINVLCKEVKKGETPQVTFCFDGKCTTIDKAKAGKWYDRLVAKMSQGAPAGLKHSTPIIRDQNGQINKQLAGISHYSMKTDDVMKGILGKDWEDRVTGQAFDAQGNPAGRAFISSPEARDKDAGKLLRYIAVQSSKPSASFGGAFDDPNSLAQEYQLITSHEVQQGLQDLSRQYQSFFNPRQMSPFDYYQSFTPPEKPPSFSNINRESTYVEDRRPAPAPPVHGSTGASPTRWWQTYWRNFQDAFRRIGNSWPW